jgi:hypothetical protein
MLITTENLNDPKADLGPAPWLSIITLSAVIGNAGFEGKIHFPMLIDPCIDVFEWGKCSI